MSGDGVIQAIEAVLEQKHQLEVDLGIPFARRRVATDIAKAADPEFENMRRWASDALSLDRRDGGCICDSGPESAGPEEDCPWHGREYAYWVELTHDLTGQRDEALAEVERLRAAAKTLGDIIVRNNQMALDATGLHHLINEDGDGDWAAVWDRIGQLGAEQ